MIATPETGEDFIDVQRDAKKDRARLSAAEYRDKYFKLAKVHWSAKQWSFINETGKFVYNRAANQSGKSYAVGGLTAYTATGIYPPEYTGWAPKLRTNGAYAVVIWVISTTSQMARDGLQTILLGDVAGADIGTGLIPKDNIVSLQMSRGVAGSVDFAVIRRNDGTLTKIAFKTYEQGRGALQAEAVSLVVCDELLDDLGIWNELIARTTTTGGRIRLTATERLQSSPVALWFRENAGPDVKTLSMSIDEAEHLSAEEKAAILASYKTEAERKRAITAYPSKAEVRSLIRQLAKLRSELTPLNFLLISNTSSRQTSHTSAGATRHRNSLRRSWRLIRQTALFTSTTPSRCTVLLSNMLLAFSMLAVKALGQRGPMMEIRVKLTEPTPQVSTSVRA